MGLLDRLNQRYGAAPAPVSGGGLLDRLNTKYGSGEDDWVREGVFLVNKRTGERKPAVEGGLPTEAMKISPTESPMGALAEGAIGGAKSFAGGAIDQLSAMAKVTTPGIAWQAAHGRLPLQEGAGSVLGSIERTGHDLSAQGTEQVRHAVRQATGLPGVVGEASAGLSYLAGQSVDPIAVGGGIAAGMERRAIRMADELAVKEANDVARRTAAYAGEAAAHVDPPHAAPPGSAPIPAPTPPIGPPEPSPILARKTTEPEITGSIDPRLQYFRHTYADDTGRTVGEINGEIIRAGEGQPGVLAVRTTNSDIASRGAGHGRSAYMDLVNYAAKNDLIFKSDAVVSSDAARVYDSLTKRGFTVEKNPNARLIDHGSWQQWAVDEGLGDSVYTITPAPPVRLSVEYTPNPKSGHMPWLEDADYGIRAEYARRVQENVANSGLLDAHGLTNNLESNVIAPSAYGEVVNPSAQFAFRVPHSNGVPDPAFMAKIQAFGEDLGRMSHQEAVGWNYVTPVAPHEASAIGADLGRTLTSDETTSLMQHLRTAGVDLDAIAPIPTAQGVDVIHFGQDLTGEVRAKIHRALDDALGEKVLKYDAYAHNSDLIGGSDAPLYGTGRQAGEGALAGSVGDPALTRARDTFQAAQEALGKEFERYAPAGPAPGADAAARAAVVDAPPISSGAERLAAARAASAGADPVVAPRPRLSAQAMAQYQTERAAVEAEVNQNIQIALSQGQQVTKEQAADALKTRMRQLDADWHERAAKAASLVDEPAIAHLADSTEHAVTQEVVGPPVEPAAPMGSTAPPAAGGPPAPGAPAADGMGTLIVRDHHPDKLTLGARLRATADEWTDKMMDKLDAPVRYLRRGGHGAEAREMELMLSRARGAADAEKVNQPIMKGVYLYDKATGGNRRVYDSLHSVIGGLDKQASTDLEDMVAAQHHMELVGRQQKAATEYSAAIAQRNAEVKAAQTAATAARAEHRALGAEGRAALAERIRLARAEGRGTGEASARAAAARRSARMGRAGELRSDLDLSLNAVGRQSRAQDLQGHLPTSGGVIDDLRGATARIGETHAAVAEARKVAVPEPHPDIHLEIDPRGTEIAKSKLAELAKRYGAEVDPMTGLPIADSITGAQRIKSLDAIADRLREWSRHSVIEQLDSIGYFKPGQKEALLAKNQRYSGMFRVLDEVGANSEFDIATAGVSGGKPIRRIGGGLSPDHPIHPPLESFTAQAQRVSIWVERQRVRNLIGDFAESNVDIGKEFKRSFPGGPRGVPVYRDGVKYEYIVPEDVRKALELTSPAQAGFLMQSSAAVARLLRSGATLVPSFSIRNFIRDQATAGVYGAEFKFRPVADFFAGLAAQTPMGGKLRAFADHFAASGAGMSDIISANRPQVQATVREALSSSPKLVRLWNEFKAEGIVGKVLFPLVHPLERASGVVEKATRIGAFRRAQLASASELEAAHYARNITLDFGKAGSFMQKYNSVEAFANASFQDVSRFSAALKDRPVATTISAGAYLTIPAIANWAANHDDPRYQALPKWEKMAFYHLGWTDDNRPIRFPRPQGVLNLIFSWGAHEMLDAALVTKDGPQMVSEMSEALFNETPLKYSPVGWDTDAGWKAKFDWIPTAAQPLVETGMNYSEFRQGKIVPESMGQGLLPQDQIFDTTSATARGIGGAIGASPLKIDYLIRGYGAGAAADALAIGERGASALGMIGQDPNALPQLPATMKDVPGVGGLIGTSPFGFASQPAQDFYKLEESAKQADGSLKQAIEAGRVDDYHRVIREHPEVLIAKDLAGVRRDLGDLRELRHVIRTAPGMEPDVRMERLMQIDQQVTTLSGAYMHWAADYIRAAKGSREKKTK